MTDLRIRTNKEAELSLDLIGLSYSMYYCMSLGLSSGSFILMIPVFVHSNYYLQPYLQSLDDSIFDFPILIN